MLSISYLLLGILTNETSLNLPRYNLTCHTQTQASISKICENAGTTGLTPVGDLVTREKALVDKELVIG